MTVKCYRKPNRSRVREFTESDLIRISALVKKNGSIWWQIIGAVAIGAGVGYLFCRLARVLQAASTIILVVQEILIVVAGGQAVKIVIEFLKNGPLIRVPLVNRAVLVIIVVLVLVNKLLNAFEVIAKDLGFLLSIIDDLNDMCNYIDGLVRKIRKKGKADILSEQDRLLAL